MARPLSFYTRSAPQDVTVTIRDQANRIVRVLEREDLGEVRAGGITRAYWNLRYDPLPVPPSQRPAPNVSPFFSGAQKRAHSYQQIQRDELDPLAAPFVMPGTVPDGVVD